MKSGLMSGTYFVSKGEILAWVNSFLELETPLTKVEQLADGWHYCQILDAIFPGKVPLGRVEFNVTQEYQRIQNLKVVQACLLRCGIEQNVDVEKVAKARPLDNLELAQFFKAVYDTYSTSVDLSAYDAVGRRAGKAQAAPSAASLPAKSANPTSRRSKTDLSSAPPSRQPARANPAAARAGPTTRERELTSEVQTLSVERRFYLDKLRRIEMIIQGLEDVGAVPDGPQLMGDIKTILYEEFDPQQQYVVD
jgi:RP/EB family microtubule-associated protein